MEFVLRPPQQSDLDDLYSLAVKVAPGMTTFPPNKKILLDKITASTLSLNSPIKYKDFLFVLEDLDKGRVIGTAGIYGDIGKEKPFYSYKIVHEYCRAYDIDLKKTSISRPSLHLDTSFDGQTEVGTLILDPAYRGKKLGEILAKSRYLFLAQFNHFFGERVLAELRGWSDADHVSPFWESLGKLFFNDISYEQADLLSASTDNQFIVKLMPKFPIYLDTLSEEAKKAVGKPHLTGEPALKMLLSEGFSYTNTIDIFDGGPTVDAPLNSIKTVRESKLLPVFSTDYIEDNTDFLICTTSINNFRVGRCKASLINDQFLMLSNTDLIHLNIVAGDWVRYVRL